MRRQLASGTRYAALAAAGLLLVYSLAMAQSGPWNGPPPRNVGPGQPAGPQPPTLTRRPPPPPPPFVLTPQEQAELDRVLAAWEHRGKEVRTFDCAFTRWEYDDTFPGKPDKNNPGGAKYIHKGTISYAAPDKGYFDAADTQKDPEGRRHERWICDGKSVFEYDWLKRTLTEYPLPPELQGKAIVDGPLPFLFGAQAEQLKQRYYLKIITPPGAQGEIWLDARPRYQRDAREFDRAILILEAKGMVPSALKIYYPGRTISKVYKFDDVVVNDLLPQFFKGTFQPNKPFGWKKVVETPPTPPTPPAQATRAPLSARQ